ncbi:MAG: hypothetical protein ACTSVA_02795 [Candidatus Njordarchaeales archaeon]
MRLLHKRRLLAVIVLISIASSAVILALPRILDAISLMMMKSGLLISIDIRKTDIRFGRYYITAQIIAMLPNGTEATIYAGPLRYYRIILDPYQNAIFREVIDSWIKYFSNATDKDVIKVALFLSLWIVNKDNPREYYRLIPERTILYNPFEILKTRKIWRIKLGEKDFRMHQTNTSLSDLKSFKGSSGAITPAPRISYRWFLKIRWPSEKIYTEIPVIIFNNIDNVSGSIFGVFYFCPGIYGLSFSTTFAYGFRIYDLAKNKEYDKINLDVRIGGYCISRDLCLMEHISYLSGNRQEYIYIIGSPIYYLYEEYLIAYDSHGNVIYKEPTGNEMIKTYICDIKYPSPTSVGKEDGLPNLMNILFMGTTIEPLFLDAGSLADGDLEPEEEEALSFIKWHFDLYDYHLSMAIPIGALIASILPRQMSFLSPVLAGLGVFMDYEDGIIKNEGKVNAESYNVTEDVYITISRYTYETSLGPLDIPLGVYFLFDTEEVQPHDHYLNLYVFTKNGWVNKTSLNMSSIKNQDITLDLKLSHIPTTLNGKFLFRLAGQALTLSYIDHVQLLAVLKNNSIVALPLVSAIHNAYGDVLPWLINSDDLQIPCVGSLHTPSGNHEIFLEFDSLDLLSEIASLIFQIEGHSVF